MDSVRPLHQQLSRLFRLANTSETSDQSHGHWQYQYCHNDIWRLAMLQYTQITITRELSWGEKRHKTGRKRCFNLANIGLWDRPVIIGRIGDIKTSIRLSWVSTWNTIQLSPQPSNISEILKTGICLKYYLGREKHLLFHSTIQRVNHNGKLCLFYHLNVKYVKYVRNYL